LLSAALPGCSSAGAGKIGFCHCATVLQTQVPKLCTDLGLSLLYILTLGTYSKFARKNHFLALGVCLPQPCSSLAACLPRQHHVYKTTDESFRFHNKNFDEMRCKMDSTENLRSFEKYPTPGCARSRNTQPRAILQRISSKFQVLLWKQNDSSVVLYT